VFWLDFWPNYSSILPVIQPAVYVLAMGAYLSGIHPPRRASAYGPGNADRHGPGKRPASPESARQSTLDSMTQVYNHGYFVELVRREITTAEKENTPVSLIML